MEIGGAAGLGEFALGGAVGQLAASKVGEATYEGLRQDGVGNRAASTISGAASGGTFAGAAGATTLALRAGSAAVQSALAGVAEKAEEGEGIEMTETAGEAAETAGEVV